MTYYASDYHFAHNKWFIFQNRGFASMDEHDDAIVERHNAVVNSEDTVIFLGDFCFDKKRIYEFLSRLKGRFVFIMGNHDGDFEKFLKRLVDSSDYPALRGKVIEVIDGYLDTNIAGHPTTLCHYAMRSWNKSHFNAWQLHGHHHYPTNFEGKILNVAMDCHDCRPWSEDEIMAYMETRPNNPDFLEKKA
jgi:calcineurin-like phosphoesterase family protein